MQIVADSPCQDLELFDLAKVFHWKTCPALHSYIHQQVARLNGCSYMGG